MATDMGPPLIKEASNMRTQMQRKGLGMPAASAKLFYFTQIVLTKALIVNSWVDLTSEQYAHADPWADQNHNYLACCLGKKVSTKIVNIPFHYWIERDNWLLFGLFFRILLSASSDLGETQVQDVIQRNSSRHQSTLY